MSDELAQLYVDHVHAMTGEGLHSKADIAAELAYRDSVIKELRKQLDSARKDSELLESIRAVELSYRRGNMMAVVAMEELKRILYPSEKSIEEDS